jgi:site-specific recombinase XerD
MEQKRDLQSQDWKLLHKGFGEWLQLLNYSKLSIPVLLQAAKQFLKWMEANGKTTTEQISGEDGMNYIHHLREGISIRTGKPLSGSGINKQIQALKLLSKYMRETGKSPVGFVLERMEASKAKPTWLTKAEIESLYDAIPNSLLGIRDKAMLAVFYGCGLRLNEGASLEVTDVIEARKLLHVRKGKRSKERLVPIADKNHEEIRLYLDYARPLMVANVQIESFFIDANKGKGLTKQSLYVRLKKLAKKAEITKPIGVHTLRHSIATHLLQSGMKLERIKEFLGHADLDSTQIYTHLKNEPWQHSLNT